MCTTLASGEGDPPACNCARPDPAAVHSAIAAPAAPRPLGRAVPPFAWVPGSSPTTTRRRRRGAADWYWELPPMTRGLLTVYLVTGLSAFLGVLPLKWLYHDWHLTFKILPEVWGSSAGLHSRPCARQRGPAGGATVPTRRAALACRPHRCGGCSPTSPFWAGPACTGSSSSSFCEWVGFVCWGGGAAAARPLHPRASRRRSLGTDWPVACGPAAQPSAPPPAPPLCPTLSIKYGGSYELAKFAHNTADGLTMLGIGAISGMVRAGRREREEGAAGGWPTGGGGRDACAGRQGAGRRRAMPVQLACPLLSTLAPAPLPPLPPSHSRSAWPRGCWPAPCRPCLSRPSTPAP